ncbi:RNA-guided endonuclease InsQ/TnpB family protein [Calothrix sp. CCY 0018]|uniref:RNA-guided endonuclease InsQ/TnpB family protein n=1 Tax=Calothrix sp. CCY 0018 TaxID=3103864 RepID=UPI0039C5B2C5
MFTLTYEFKIKTTKREQAIFEEWLEINRRVYNYALRERKDWYESRKCQVNACSLKQCFVMSASAPRPTYNQQAKQLTAAKKEYLDLKKPQSQVLQQTLMRLEKAFVSMWEQNHGFPRFKKAGRMRSFVFPQVKNEWLWEDQIYLPKIGWLIIRNSRPIPKDAQLKQFRVVKRARGWYVQITASWEVNPPSPIPNGRAIGIDVGLTSFAATSNGLLIKRPRFFVDLQNKLKSLQRKVFCKIKGSNNWKKAQHKVARLHERIANTRKDWHYKLAHRLCNDVGMIFVENLNLVGLSRGMLGKHCLDAGFGQFFNILEQICFKRGVYFEKVDSHKTSQICPNCQHETGKKTLANRVHSCENCGYTTDRDVAAAQVVLLRGLAAVGHTVKMLCEGKSTSFPVSKESQSL